MKATNDNTFVLNEFIPLMKKFLSIDSSDDYNELIDHIHKISKKFTLKEISDLIFQEAISLTNSKYCYVAYVDPENNDSVGISFSHLTDACNMYAKMGEARFKVLSDGSYGGLLGYSLDTGKSFYIRDISSHPAAHGLPPGHERVDQFLSVPVKYKEKIVGQIVLAEPEEDFNDTHLVIIDKLADFYGIFLKEILY